MKGYGMMLDTKEIKERIKKDILSILKEKLSCTCQEAEQNSDEPLTGSPFFLSEIDMVYLLFEVEKKFGIRVAEESLVGYGFSTLNQIITLVQEYL